jgi:hypothetical protein
MWIVFVLVGLAANGAYLLLHLIAQVINRDGWPKIRETLLWLLLPLGVGVYKLFLPINPYPVHRFSDAMIRQLKPGMTKAEVQAVLKGPAGHYGNPEFLSGRYSIERITFPPGTTTQAWSDDGLKVELAFDSRQVLVTWYRRADAQRYFEPLVSPDSLRTLLRAIGL